MFRLGRSWRIAGRISVGFSLERAATTKPSPSYRLVREDLEPLAALPGANAETSRDLAETTRRIGGLLIDTGRSQEGAEVELSKALSLYKKLVDDNPNVLSFQEDLAHVHDNVGILRRNMGKPYEQAEAAFRESLRIRKKLAADNPAVIIFQEGVARSLDWLGWHAQQAGKNKEAMEYCIQEETIIKKLAQAGTGFDARGGLANIQVNMADILRKNGNLAEARILCEQAIKMNEEFVKSDPSRWDSRGQLGESYFRLGQVHYDMKHLAEAAADWKKAIQQYAELPSLNYERCFLSDLLPRRPGGACRKTGLRGFDRGGPGRAEKGPDLAARGSEDLPKPRRLSERNGLRPDPQKPRVSELDERSGEACQADREMTIANCINRPTDASNPCCGHAGLHCRI